MHDDESPDFGMNDSELAAFEARLQALTPHWRLDRDRLMFAAGERASGRQFRIRNRFYGGLSATLAVLLAVAVVTPRESERLAVEPPESAAAFATRNPLAIPNPAGGDNAAAVSGEVFVARSASTSFDQVQRMQDSAGTQEAASADGRKEKSETAPPPSTSRGLLHRYLNVAT